MQSGFSGFDHVGKYLKFSILKSWIVIHLEWLIRIQVDWSIDDNSKIINGLEKSRSKENIKFAFYDWQNVDERRKRKIMFLVGK